MYKYLLNIIYINVFAQALGGIIPTVNNKPSPHIIPYIKRSAQPIPVRKIESTYGYSHEDTTKLNNSHWMADIADSALLSQITIPGTHETMSLYGGILPQCQTLDLESQIRAGIRALDIRCRHQYNQFRIHHEIFDQKVYFNQVLDILIKFLSQNPSEVILMRVREEYTAVGINRTFEQTFKNYITPASVSPYIWSPTTDNPTVGEVRGKIVFMQDFGSYTPYGLNYYSFDIQDDYEVLSIYGLYDKWTSVKNQLIKADGRPNADQKFLLNYLSGSTGFYDQIPLLVFPYFVAGGRADPRTDAPLFLTGVTTVWPNATLWPDFPRVNCLGPVICLIAFEGTNDLTLKYIQNQRPDYLGILMIDFPGDLLIDSLIKLNNFTDSVTDEQQSSTTESIEEAPDLTQETTEDSTDSTQQITDLTTETGTDSTVTDEIPTGDWSNIGDDPPNLNEYVVDSDFN